MNSCVRFFSVFALFAVGCGGGDPSGPPQEPTGPGAPASVSIAAGDNQTAEPGSTVPIVPVVVVKDANGQGVSGAVVSFAVDSGGGAIQTGSATTGANGTANPGSWQMGAAEGANVLRVTTSGLAPVKIRATARVATVALPAKTIPVSGGVLTWSRPGLPLDGTMIFAAPNAVGGPVTLSFSVESTAGLTLPQGITAATPAVRLDAATGLLAPIAIRFPIALPLTTNLAVVSRDAATGELTMLPTIARDAGGITALITSLSATPTAAYLPGFPTAALGAELPVFTVIIDPSLIAGDFDSEYRPEVDGWDMAFPTYGARGPQTGAQILYTSPLSAYPATSQWYFRKKKTMHGPLYKKFQEGPDLYSNKRGFRWTSLIETIIPQQYSAYSTHKVRNTIKEIEGIIRGQQIVVPEEDQAFEEFRALKNLFVLSNGSPQTVFLWPVTGDHSEMAVAYRTVGNAVDIANPFVPGTSFRMTLNSNGWVPLQIPVANSGTFLVSHISATPPLGPALDAVMEQTFAAVLSGTIGDAELWPKPKLMSSFGELDPEDIVLDETLRHWWECDVCEATGFASSVIVPSPPRLMAIMPSQMGSGGTWPPFATLNSSLNFTPTNLTTAGATVGTAIFQPGSDAGLSFPGSVFFWVDWRTIKYRKLDAKLSPAQLSASKDTTVTWSVTAPNTPAGVKYRWIYRGAATDSVETMVPSHTRLMSEGSRMVVKLIQGEGKRPIARDSVSLAAAPFPVWRVTSVPQLSIELVPLTPGQRTIFSTEVNNFVTDSLFWTGIKNGERDGALVFATGDAGALVHRGLWMMPLTPVDFPNIPSKPSPMYGLIDVSRGSRVSPVANERYEESGTPYDNFMVSGLSWGVLREGHPATYRDVSIAFSGTTATATMDFVYRAPGLGVTWHITATFEATRIR